MQFDEEGFATNGAEIDLNCVVFDEVPRSAGITIVEFEAQVLNTAAPQQRIPNSVSLDYDSAPLGSPSQGREEVTMIA